MMGLGPAGIAGNGGRVVARKQDSDEGIRFGLRPAGPDSERSHGRRFGQQTDSSRHAINRPASPAWRCHGNVNMLQGRKRSRNRGELGYPVLLSDTAGSALPRAVACRITWLADNDEEACDA